MSSVVGRGARPQEQIRIGDAERERVRVALQQHVAEGRLTLDEYGERVGEVFAARTGPELAAALRELPELPPGALPAPPAQVRERRRRTAAAVGGWLALAALFLTIWAATGAGYFWPIWPILGTGMGTLATVRGLQEASAAGRTGPAGDRPAPGARPFPATWAWGACGARSSRTSGSV